MEITGVTMTFAPATTASQVCTNAALARQTGQRRAETDAAVKTSQQVGRMPA